VLDLDTLFSSIPDNNLDLYIDIGLSHNAPYSVEKLRDNPKAFVIGVEPNPDSCLSIRKNHIPESEERFLLIQCGIGDTEKVEYRKFNITVPDAGCSSFLDVNPHKTHDFYAKEEIIVPVVGLKYILDRLPWDRFSSRNFDMKSDTQGFEDKVILGMGEYVKNIRNLQIESTTWGKYHAASNHEDVKNMLTAAGMTEVRIEGENAWFTRE
jgi:FkbM family methyltransferase